MKICENHTLGETFLGIDFVLPFPNKIFYVDENNEGHTELTYIFFKRHF